MYPAINQYLNIGLGFAMGVNDTRFVAKILKKRN